MKRVVPVICVLLSLALAPWAVSVNGATPAPGSPAPANPATQPDLSSYDAETLRTIAGQLYTVINGLQQQIKFRGQELTAARNEYGRLKQIADRLQERVNKLQNENNALRQRLAGQGGTPGSSPSSTTNPVDSESAAASSEDGAVGRKDTSPTGKAIAAQKPTFAELNKAPGNYLGKSLTLLGYADMSNHVSKGVFSDPGTPRQFIALTDTQGQRIFVSLPKQGNDALFEMLNRKPRTAIKVDAMGASTISDRVFEAAGTKWQALEIKE